MSSRAAAVDQPDAVKIIKPSPAEWDDFVRDQLDQLGVTLDELRRQARERDFQSTDARSVWVMIGGSF